MKIKTKNLSYDEVMKLPRPEHKNPIKPNPLLTGAIRLYSTADMIATKFRYTEERMDKVKDKPCLILMNHSSFIDLKIASKIFYPRRYGIVCTSDGFIGKRQLMRMIGCIPTQKFVNDVTLINDIKYMLHENKTSVLMYPEASYSFDGTATALPRKMGVLIKRLNVPVVTIITKGAFARDPLYNMLQRRQTNVSAHVKCLLTTEEIKEKSTAEIDEMLDKEFSFDNFRWQKDNKIEISEPFRADGLHRILYKCSECGTEGKTEGKDTKLICKHCGKEWELTTLGELKPLGFKAKFNHIPDWYAWERDCVRKELENGTYRLETDVKIGIMVDYKAIYMVGKGHLSHSNDGFRLTGCDGKLNYEQTSLANYGLYSDYFWYELGDMICIGDKDALYYCFPQNNTPVAKTRMAAEELYKLTKSRKKKKLPQKNK